jgi:hypothetical protein
MEKKMHRAPYGWRNKLRGKFGAESYAEMMRKYTYFRVYVPGVGFTLFNGAHGELAAYDGLMGMHGAEITEFTLRVNLARPIRDLMSRRYSNQLPDRIHAPPADGVIAAYNGELDGENVEIMLLVVSGTLEVTAGTTVNHGDRTYAEVKMRILNFESANPEQCTELVRGAMLPYAATSGDLIAVCMSLSGRAVFVSDMEVESRMWSERPLRIMHAAVALLAQIGVISGASIVVIDKRGYGYGSKRMPYDLERGLSESKYKYKLRSIGPHLVVARADELVDPLDGVDAYGLTRAAQIGAIRRN